MLNRVAGLAAALILAGAAQAQDAPHEDTPGPDTAHRSLSQADLNVLTDARIGMAKSLLRLTPEQTGLWPPVEEALRNDAEARYRRIDRHRAAAARDSESETDPLAALRSRSEVLSERAASLKGLADALQPLCQTLNPEQKDRMRLVASYILRETRGAMGHHRAGAEGDEGEDD